MKTEPTCPDYTENIRYKVNIKTQLSIVPKEKKVNVKNNDQKKILEYMHKNHNKTFRYLNTQLTEFCSSLPQEEEESWGYLIFY